MAHGLICLFLREQLEIILRKFNLFIVVCVTLTLYKILWLLLHKKLMHMDTGHYTIDIRLLIGIGNGVTRPVYYLYN